MGKEGNVAIEIKYISLLKKCYFKEVIFHFNLLIRNQKTCKFYLL